MNAGSLGGLKIPLPYGHFRIWKRGFEFGNRSGGRIWLFPWVLRVPSITEPEILASCNSLNFMAIANILEGYGWRDPENTLTKLRELEENMRQWRKRRRMN